MSQQKINYTTSKISQNSDPVDKEIGGKGLIIAAAKRNATNCNLKQMVDLSFSDVCPQARALHGNDAYSDNENLIHLDRKIPIIILSIGPSHEIAPYKE